MNPTETAVSNSPASIDELAAQLNTYSGEITVYPPKDSGRIDKPGEPWLDRVQEVRRRDEIDHETGTVVESHYEVVLRREPLIVPIDWVELGDQLSRRGRCLNCGDEWTEGAILDIEVCPECGSMNVEEVTR